MDLIRWSPFDELDLIQDEMNKLFDGSRRKKKVSNEFSVWAPSADVVETKDAYKVEVDIPGIPKDEIDISVSGNTLSIKGERKLEKEEKDKKTNYYRAERVFGIFERHFSFAQKIDENKVKASYTNGVLQITLPKKEEEKAKLIKIQ